MKIVIALLILLLGSALPLMAQPPIDHVQVTPASVGATPGQQQDEDLNLRAYIQLLRTDIRNSREDIVRKVMQLDAAQGSTFWPIYKNFQKDLDKIGDQITSVITDYSKDYDEMTEQLADRLATQVLNIQQQRNELKRKYYRRFRTALDPITAARFLQVENQLENLLDLQVESRLPVIGKSDK